MYKCFGVDIGNSGCRVAELQLATRQLGTMLRIDWCHEQPGTVGSGGPGKRYRPGDPAWLLEVERFVAEQFAARHIAESAPALWMISSVRRDASKLLLNYLESRADCRVELVGYASLPLKIEVESPEKVGIDRLLAALAAIALTPQRPLLVVQAGSAVTVDLVSAFVAESRSLDTPPLDNVLLPAVGDSPGAAPAPWATFEGGAILPGVPMMLRLLGQGADMLPEVEADELVDLPPLPGRNTEQAMRCGTASALVGGVWHLIQRYRQEYGEDLPVILSGGDGMRLSPYVEQPRIMETHLVHRGLLRLAEQLAADS
ncbi:MAG: type III pantothenate kinase [Planctomycetales bacterium]|nr:type III pantothenate kinase [Planctomycetales bacterium]